MLRVAVRTISVVFIAALALSGCVRKTEAPHHAQAQNSYFDNAGRDDVLSGGVKMIEIDTPKGKFHVWTKRTGNNPRLKLLLLHGGPGFTHEYMECFDGYLPNAGVEFYYYDQLGSYYSDQPADSSLWDTARFVEEVEQVRTALHLDKDNFYLLGHSWGGILAMEYALKYQEHLKGLIISNMMSDIPAYSAYAKTVFKASMDPAVLKELMDIEAAKDYENPHYMELLIPNHYEKHILRLPYAQWPDPFLRAFKHMNPAVYIPMQGPSELDCSGKLEKWSREADLPRIMVPTLVIGAQYDTMDPKHMEMMSKKLPHGRYLYCANGSHMAMYDDQATYMDGVTRFIKDVDEGRF